MQRTVTTLKADHGNIWSVVQNLITEFPSLSEETAKYVPNIDPRYKTSAAVYGVMPDREAKRLSVMTAEELSEGTGCHNMQMQVHVGF